MIGTGSLTAQWKDKISVQLIEGKGQCLLSRQNFATGEVIGYFEGDETCADSMHSIHLDGKVIDGTGPLKNLGHSCDPNAVFKDKGRWLHASRPISAGAEITIDYLATEPGISEPFTCECQASKNAGASSARPSPDPAISCLAVPDGIHEINHHSHSKPYDEPHIRLPWQEYDQGAAGQHA